MEHGFVSANIPMAFACRKCDHAAKPNGRSHAPPTLAMQGGLFNLSRLGQTALAGNPPNGNGFLPAAVGTAVLSPGSERLAAPSLDTQPSTPAQTDLEQARRLADTGRLADAAAICEAHLREYHASAQAYYLLGLVREAGGDGTAAECYRKALYLEPGHYETLLQMASLADKNGDLARACALKRRAQRVKATLGQR
jgi:chemotaxis protein methyltransferase WspC